MAGYLLGLDIGSSAIKASLLDAENGMTIVSACSPELEMEISSPRPGFAEQDPEEWWTHVCLAIAQIRTKDRAALEAVAAVGISYQMHGLVVVDQNQKVLRPAIIWCDSRAVSTGAAAFRGIGENECLRRLLNSPGNFTASKLKWVKDNEPAIYAKISKAMLPGDFIAMKLTGSVNTTPSGLSEGVLWDFTEENVSSLLLEHYGIDSRLLATIVPTFSDQGRVTSEAAADLGLRAGIPVAYRAGDQPNNAFSLNVLRPGEIAATAGTSGVIYGVSNSVKPDPQSRVNTFLHVNHSAANPRYGTLLCVNGTGILNSWIRKLCSADKEPVPYKELDLKAASVPPGAEGLIILPYGNGAERSLDNRDIGASMHSLSLVRHTPQHVFRAVQEGIVYALVYGLEIMNAMGINAGKIRAGNANMFLSPVFTEALACTSGATIELYETDGAQGAARGAGVGSGVFSSFEEAFRGLSVRKVIEPDSRLAPRYEESFGKWRSTLEGLLQ